ncbi:MAG: hypothetical protein IKF47_00430 [Bacilli bacterium]|nr:hypothetical protein [Bacilli bacterium]
MNLHKDKYIIVEIIPTHSDSDKGFIAQISALKLDGIKLLDRFDYRVKDELIENEDLRNIISYDKEMFTYVDNIYFIIEKFKRWAEDLPILIMEEEYTPNYLKELNNKKEIIYPYIDVEYSNDVFNKIMDKYKIEPSNHLVDILYEAIIFHGEKKED